MARTHTQKELADAMGVPVKVIENGDEALDQLCTDSVTDTTTPSQQTGE